MSNWRILFVTGEYPPHPGGVGDYTAILRDALRPHGVESLVLTTGKSNEPGVVGIDRWGWTTARRIAGIVREREIGIIHIQYQAGAFGMRPAINLLPQTLGMRGIPVVTTFHDLRPPYLFPKAGPLREFAMLRMARSSAAAIVTNPSDERVLARAGISARRIPIGPNLPPADLDGDDVDRDSVAFFGFPSRSKGIMDLIDALALMPEGRRPRLLLVGAQGAAGPNNDVLDAGEIDRHASDRHVSIDRTGYLPPREASNALARAGAIALPFHSGASLRSGSLLAALQSGRPVVTTVPARSTTLDSLTALPQLRLALQQDIVSLRDEIRAALAAPAAAEPLPDEFTWPAIAARHRSLYASLTEGQPR